MASLSSLVERISAIRVSCMNEVRATRIMAPNDQAHIMLRRMVAAPDDIQRQSENPTLARYAPEIIEENSESRRLIQCDAVVSTSEASRERNNSAQSGSALLPCRSLHICQETNAHIAVNASMRVPHRRGSGIKSSEAAATTAPNMIATHTCQPHICREQAARGISRRSICISLAQGRPNSGPSCECRVEWGHYRR